MDSIFEKEPNAKLPPDNTAPINSIVKSLGNLEKTLGDSTEVSNFDEVKLHLRNELSRLSKSIQDTVSSIKVPDAINVAGMTIRIAELTNIAQALEGLKEITTQFEFKPTITVNAPIIPEIKIPEIKIPRIEAPNVNVEAPNIKVEPIVDIDLSELLEALKPLGLLSNRPGKPISVRMSDGDKWAKALKEAQNGIVRAFSAGGMTSDEWKSAYKKVVAGQTIKSFRKVITTAGTREQLITSSTTVICIDLSADTGNAGVAVVGDNTVVAAEGSQKGLVLFAGNPATRISIINPNLLYGDVTNNGDAICGNYYEI